ncbi:hypothetical protein GSI_08800 [Ganoderma sinense ZZ0214-1]|uniref:Uncharacterized protein n=1 Tax=Ganoderma sinense ZZ0214-1 TaxID=1077348 RepID=A0A2G8S4Q3_9APHY|nr:hypothetical protein GSI_08800 [Ganoderma sinense ZZ0214-1]
MRLLDTETGQFVDKDPEDGKTVYAILSHTWDEDGEQTYEQLKEIQQRYHSGSESQTPQSRPNVVDTDSAASPKLVRALPTALGRLTASEVEALLCLVAETFGLALPAHAPGLSQSDPSMPVPDPRLSQQPPPSQSIWDDPELSPKIREACRIAREDGYDYIWIDSCCIDKSSSSELSEAINSMYKWYGLADVCYAYLSDVPSGEIYQADDSAFRKSRWFGRGWTLQELIAPLWVEFFSKDWIPIGSKHDLVDLVESITKIDEKALLHVEPLDAFSVAQRLSWAAERKTSRVEDRAYSLLGIFNINMPTLYGESDYAFRRLQEHIMERTPDQSLLAWEDVYLASRLRETGEKWEAQPDYDPLDLFATSPDLFRSCRGISTLHHHAITPTSESSHGRAMVEYTSTPYGIRTQFWMLALNKDLLLRAIQHRRPVQLEFPQSPRGSQWYLAILSCEHSEYPEHLLGRVCYIASSKSGIDLIRPGYIKGIELHANGVGNYCTPDLFPLSPDTIEHCRAQIELKTVYIPHPYRAALPQSSSIRRQLYTTMKLVLLRGTHDALRSQGYSANLRDPDPGHPTTHRLVLSNDEHTIAVEFQHTLENDGDDFTIAARVKMSGSHGVQLDSDSAPASHQAGRPTLAWWDATSWETALDHQRVELSAAGPRTLILDLGLNFGGRGYYFLHVEVLSEELPALSAVEPAGNQGGERERNEAEDLSSTRGTRG